MFEDNQSSNLALEQTKALKMGCGHLGNNLSPLILKIDVLMISSEFVSPLFFIPSLCTFPHYSKWFQKSSSGFRCSCKGQFFTSFFTKLSNASGYCDLFGNIAELAIFDGTGYNCRKGINISGFFFISVHIEKTFTDEIVLMYKKQ